MTITSHKASKQPRRHAQPETVIHEMETLAVRILLRLKRFKTRPRTIASSRALCLRSERRVNDRRYIYSKPPEPRTMATHSPLLGSSTRRGAAFLSSRPHAGPFSLALFCACSLRYCDQWLRPDVVVPLPMRCRVCAQDSRLAERPLPFRGFACDCVVCRRESSELRISNVILIGLPQNSE